jgi:hypothetical protein
LEHKTYRIQHSHTPRYWFTTIFWILTASILLA